MTHQRIPAGCTRLRAGNILGDFGGKSMIKLRQLCALTGSAFLLLTIGAPAVSAQTQSSSPRTASQYSALPTKIPEKFQQVLARRASSSCRLRTSERRQAASG